MNEPCLLCGSEWGNFRAIVRDRDEKFCCEICAIQVRNVVSAIEDKYPAETLSIIEFSKQKRGRTVLVKIGDKKMRFGYTCNSVGSLTSIQLLT